VVGRVKLNIITNRAALALFFLFVSSLSTYAAELSEVKFGLCSPQVCLEVISQKAFESQLDQTMIFTEAVVNYHEPKTKRHYRQVKGAQVTYKPNLGLIWIEGRGLSDFFDLKEGSTLSQKSVPLNIHEP
jgi:flagellar motor switch protein FliM